MSAGAGVNNSEEKRMAISRIYGFRPRPEKYDQCLGRVVEYKKLFERLGGRVRVFSAEDGGEPGSMIFVSEVDDWARFGELNAKLESDPEFQRLQALDRSDPVFDILQQSTVSEVSLPA